MLKKAGRYSLSTPIPYGLLASEEEAITIIAFENCGRSEGDSRASRNAVSALDLSLAVVV